ncbi:MAG TPA: carboxypeptidase-like regulatory domain-containing protein [Patescibacteria group bacterium]|nr:carboxypeptidase-like regulatory domain-containing protein [Patescibacteria group bacterium]
MNSVRALHFAAECSRKKTFGRNTRGSTLLPGSLFWLILSVLLCGFSAPARSQQPPIVPGAKSGLPGAPGTAESTGPRQPAQQSSGSISGTVVDSSGGTVARARIKLTRGNQSAGQEVSSEAGGQFSFTNIASGPFEITITAAGFATQTISGTLRPGEAYSAGEITLAVAAAVSEVRVGPRIAEEQIKVQEQQRVLGLIPNFYVSYIPNAVPLSPKQKFELAWKTTLDPVTFVLTGAVAGIEQSQNDFSGYGQGAQGYGKRYGASYADVVASTFIGGALLPSLLKQDPRYFYKGSGSTRSRILYAIANSVICKGDNGRWQPDYSGILGSLAAGGISDLYYPAANRNGAALAFQTTAIGIGESAAANLLQEFLLRKLTRNPAHRQPAAPEAQPASRRPNPDGY